MRTLATLSSYTRLLSLTITALLLMTGSAHAEQADRNKPIQVEADLPGKIDMLKQFVVFNGNVVVTQGTMTIRADRIELRETPEGYHTAMAYGTAAKPATFREKRDGADEYIEGQAERLEYDGKSNTVRFVGDASVRRLRGTTVADRISGQLITYNAVSEVFSVSGGSASSPSGRVRVVIAPRDAAPASAAAQGRR